MNVLACVAGVCGKTLKQFMNVYHIHTYTCVWVVKMRCDAMNTCNVCVCVCLCVWCSMCDLILLLLLCKPQEDAVTCQFCNIKMSATNTAVPK